MNSSLRLFLYAYTIPVLIGWSLYQDGIWENNRLSFGVASYVVFMFFVFSIRKDRTVSFLFKWVLGSVASVLLIVAWADFSNSKNWVVGSSILFFVAICNMAEIIQRDNAVKIRHDYIERRSVAVLALLIALFLFFVTLVVANVTPHYATYGYLLYTFIIFSLIDLWRLTQESGPSRYLRVCYYTCIWTLASIGLVLTSRRYNHQSNLPWYLIVQPFIGICSVQMARYISEVKRNSLI